MKQSRPRGRKGEAGGTPGGTRTLFLPEVSALGHRRRREMGGMFFGAGGMGMLGFFLFFFFVAALPR